MEIIFRIFGEYGKENPRETVPEGGTRHGARPTHLGAPLTLVGAP